VPKEAIEQVLGHPVSLAGTGGPRVPGSLPSHYAPKAGLLLVPPSEISTRAGTQLASGKKVAVMGQHPEPLPPGVGHFPIPADPGGFARALYATLRDIDAAGFELILAAPPPAEGLGLAVRDRLARAAAPRDG
jgi:L-threonylcarbamoyladenylate synthase